MYHCAAVRLFHQRHGVAHRMHDRFEVDSKHLVPHFQIHIDRRFVALEPQHTGCIDEIIEPPCGLGLGADSGGYRSIVADVALDIARPFWQPVRRFLKIKQRDVRARLQQAGCCG